MLNVKQPSTYGYKSLHDLPTPPSTSRSSPPLIFQDTYQKPQWPLSRGHSPVRQSMSAPHRGLPPPAAMALPPQQPPPSTGPPPQHHAQQSSMGQSHHQPSHHWTTLPAPPQQWSGAEEPMRNWLVARAEEEKTRQEEERTRQESLRLEQRKVEMDILRASLGGGIPPPMIPLVFAGMGSGGVLPQAALEWAQQFMHPSQAHQLQQLMPSHGHGSPEHQRETTSAHGQYGGMSTTPGPAPTHGSYGPYPGSPTTQRGQSAPGIVSRPPGTSSNLPSLSTNVGQQGHQPVLASHQSHQSYSHVQSHGSQPETSPSIYFHHWQPPTSQTSSGSNRPGSPSGSSKTKRKRESL